MAPDHLDHQLGLEVLPVQLHHLVPEARGLLAALPHHLHLVVLLHQLGLEVLPVQFDLVAQLHQLVPEARGLLVFLEYHLHRFLQGFLEVLVLLAHQ